MEVIRDLMIIVEAFVKVRFPVTVIIVEADQLDLCRWPKISLIDHRDSQSLKQSLKRCVARWVFRKFGKSLPPAKKRLPSCRAKSPLLGSLKKSRTLNLNWIFPWTVKRLGKEISTWKGPSFSPFWNFLCGQFLGIIWQDPPLINGC